MEVIKCAQKIVFISLFSSLLFIMLKTDNIDASNVISTTKNNFWTSTLSDDNEISANESTQSDSSLGQLKESQKISTIFPDPVVAKYIANSLNKNVYDEVTQNDLDNVKSFYLPWSNVKSIEGFQYLSYVNDISIYGNEITDLSPFNEWYPKSYWGEGYNLFHIWLSQNPITDLTPLANVLMREHLKIFSLALHDMPIDNSQIPNLRKISNNHTYIPKHTFGYNHIDDFEKLQGTIFSDLNPLSIDGPTPYGTLGNWGHTIDMGTLKVDSDGEITVPNNSTYFDGSKIPVTEISNGGKASSDNKFVTWTDLYKGKPEKLTFTVSKEPDGLCGTSVTYTVHLEYQDAVPAKQGKVTAKYVDTEGKTIAPDKVLTGDVDTAYQTEKQAIDGYTFKEIQGKATGKYTEADQTVTYVYTKDATPAKQGKVTAKYVDTDGKTIAPDKVLTGDIDTAYKTEQQSIAGYTLKEVQGKATGKYTESDQTVTYIYTKDAVPAKKGKVTAKYVDTDGKTIAPDKVLTGDVDTAYQTEKQAIDGYTFKEIQGKATGKYTESDQTVTYIYTKQANSKPAPNENENKPNHSDQPGQSNSQNPSESNKHKQASFGDKVQTGVKKLLPNTGEKQQVYLSILGVVILGTVGYFFIKKRK